MTGHRHNWISIRRLSDPFDRQVCSLCLEGRIVPDPPESEDGSVDDAE